uniref:Uncharacterized protein n=1 Tax=Anguilla anguilla TaxID=7936 RepID=A0A0E9W4V7_ANGAN
MGGAPVLWPEEWLVVGALVRHMQRVVMETESLCVELGQNKEMEGNPEHSHMTFCKEGPSYFILWLP